MAIWCVSCVVSRRTSVARSAFMTVMYTFDESFPGTVRCQNVKKYTSRYGMVSTYYYTIDILFE